MLILKYNDTVLRNVVDVAYAIDVEVCLYKGPLVMKTVSKYTSPDNDVTEDFEVPDWDNSTKLGSKTSQYIIPTNKQTSSYQPNHGELKNDYNELAVQWRETYTEDADIKRIYLELCEEFKSHDGYFTT